MNTRNIPHPTDASIILTYRCPMKCKMCNIWFNPRKRRNQSLGSPHAAAAEIHQPDRRRTVRTRRPGRDRRRVLQAYGSHRHLHLGLVRGEGHRAGGKIPANRHPYLHRGLSCKNDELRGHAGGFDKGLRTLLALKQMGLKDIGFGCTVSNNNSRDMLSLYQLSKSLGMEFATAAFHNSYYFHKDDNVITNKDEVCRNFEQLIAW